MYRIFTYLIFRTGTVSDTVPVIQNNEYKYKHAHNHMSTIELILYSSITHFPPKMFIADTNMYVLYRKLEYKYHEYKCLLKPLLPIS